MKHKHPYHEHNPAHHPVSDYTVSSKDCPSKQWKFAYWIMGIGSLAWLLLRSGTKPKRLTYPCQRIAATNSAGFLAYLATLLGSATLLRRLKKAFSPSRLILFAIGLLLTVTLQSSITDPAVPILAASPDLPGWTSQDAVSNVFVITNVPEPEYSLDGGSIPGGVSPDEALHDDGVDGLVTLMETHGDYFYKTTAHPTGLFDSNDVVVIKVNNQWAGRNSTNTDVVKGVIHRLVNHPAGFTGAVIIAENAQGRNPDWAYESGNNSQFQDQSYQEVASTFAGQGYHVCTETWGNLNREDTTRIVNEYNSGDSDEGYVLVAGDASEGSANRRLSYPKFAVNCNGMDLQISMQRGIWNSASSSFDNERLKMINLPVLKYHSASGATISVKNYLGFVSVCSGDGSIGSCSNGEFRWINPGYKHCWLLSTATADGGTCTTYTQEYGLIGRQMAHIRRADLDIVDAIWVNPRNNAGFYDRARRQDVLLASRDPFALDYYASDYVLGPLVQTYESSLDHTQAMASIHSSLFRSFLMRNIERLRDEGINDTIDMNDSWTTQQELDQFNVYVGDADDPLSPTLTLQAPNGDEVWTVGTQEQILWDSTGEVGPVRLEYSTDGFVTPITIIDSTANDGAYTWTIPNTPSTDALVRVSSTLSDTISDISNGVFTIAGLTFEDSFKTVSHRKLEGGEKITYTIVLYEETSATLTLTDTIPSPCTYVPGSANIEPSWNGTLQFPDSAHIHWSGVVTSMVPVTITFQAQVPVTTTTMVIINRALVSRDGAAPVQLQATSFLNGFYAYLPAILKNY